MSKDRILVLFFDDNGLEQLHDISDFPEKQEEKVFAKLAGQEYEDGEIDFTYMRLRARYNTPRNYHLIGIKMPGEITDEIIRDSLALGADSNLRRAIISEGVDLL